MLFKDDELNKKLERLIRRDSSMCQSYSSVSTAASSTDGQLTGSSNDMIQALIRDLSFWDAIPPTKSFPIPLPKRPSPPNPTVVPDQQQQPILRRGGNVSSRDPTTCSQFSSAEYYRQQQQQKKLQRRNSDRSNKGTIEEHSSSSWRPLPKTVWKTAVDPMTGRTYYYDAVTRRTQWEKPAEVRQLEKQKKSQRRKRDRIFFQEMEKNILKSLSRGEVVPGIPKAQLEPTGPPLEPRNAKTPLGARSVRTLSRMDDTILAELRDDVVSPEEFDRAIQAQRNVIRSSSRGRPPLPGATRSFNKDRSRSRSGSQRRGMDSREPLNEASQPSGKTTSSSSSSVRRQPNSQGNSVKLNVPPRRSASEREDPSGSDALAGEHLLDGPLQAEINNMADKADTSINKNHVRRNTGGTIYVNGTMSNPNVEATIKCVCGVYRAHLVQAAEQRKGKNNSPVSVISKPLDMEIFNDRYHLPVSWKHNMHQETLPSLSDIVDFYQEFYKRSQMEFDTIIMSLIYVERLIKTTNVTPGPENWRSVLFSCMVLASKVWDDLSMWNIDFSNVASAHSQGMALFTLQRVNQLELVLLKSLNFDVRVPASEYAKYYFLIRTMLLRSGLLEGAAKPLGKEEAKGLENRTSHYQDSKLGGGNQRDRRTKSMYDYSWFEKTSQPEIYDADCLPDGGPVLKDKVCLEQIVNMSKNG